MSSELWTTVKKKAKSSNKSSSRTTNNNSSKGSDSFANNGNKSKSTKALNKAVIHTNVDFQFGLEDVKKSTAALRKSLFYEEILNMFARSSLIHFDSLFGLGIGNFSSSPSSLLQLALFILLSEQFMSNVTDAFGAESVNRSLYIFDPTMSSDDVAICGTFGISVLTENKRGKHDVIGNTLFFMPHCPYRLYCNLLWQNWNCLHTVYILGNRY